MFKVKSEGFTLQFYNRITSGKYFGCSVSGRWQTDLPAKCLKKTTKFTLNSLANDTFHFWTK
jgi:hypothetical protein